MNQILRTKMLILETRIGIYPTPVSSVTAIEKTQQDGLIIYTQERILTGVNSNLYQLENQCADNFIYLNRQCLVNKAAISHVIPKTREIYVRIMNNELKKFSCSRNKFRELIKWLESIANTHGDESAQGFNAEEITLQ